jgi:DNA-binding PadR family transcriptional regulator
MRRKPEAIRPPKNPDPEVFLPLPHLPFHILLALSKAPRHGWGVVQQIGELTEGRDEPSSGSLYLAMSRLVERGLIEDAPPPDSETNTRRRYFRLTPLGRRVLAAETERLAGLVDISRRWSAVGGRGGGGGGAHRGDDG